MKEKTKLKKEIIALLAKVTEVKNPVKNNKLQIDSLMGIEIVIALEKQYKITIRDRDIAQLASFDSMVELVFTLQQKKIKKTSKKKDKK